MNWSKGFSVSHYATIVDPLSWKDMSKVQIQNGSINRSISALVESADLTCEHLDESIFETEQWIRIYADIRQSDGAYHAPLFTGLASSPSKSINGIAQQDQLQCYSTLKPAEDILLDRGYYVPTGSDVARTVRELLSVSPAPIYIDDISGETMESIVAENNESNLSMAWKLLDLMGWTLRISGDGSITITGYPTIDDSSVIFDSVESDSLETSITVDYDRFNCPNVFRAVHNASMAVARDESDSSPLSVQNRGREVWMEETNCVLQSNETLGDYAKRRLREEQNVAYSLSYTRRYHPDVNISDVIRLNYPAQRVSGYYRVDSQTINLGFGVSVSEKANRIL